MFARPSIASVVALMCVVAAAATLSVPPPMRSYVYLRGGVASVTTNGSATAAAATVDYTPAMKSIGWDVLNVTTNAALDDLDQAYAAGYGEGFVTQLGCWNEWLDNFGAYPNGTLVPLDVAIPANVAAFISENWAWTKAQVVANNATDNYWYQVGLQLRQWEGMLDGINAAAAPEQQMSFNQLQYTSLIGDLYDLVPALSVNATTKTATASEWRSMTKPEYERWLVQRTHCSALVKVAADFSDIYFGHVTWSGYNTILRIYKHYTLNFATERGAVSKTISFSGYPAALSSIDDFYLVDTGLFVGETSIGVLNMSMYRGTVQPQSLMYWIRIMVANRMESTAPGWAHTYAKHNSGTYNGQYFALDLKLFVPGQDLQPNTMMIAEQLPGVVGIQDVTAVLSSGYWPSYNLPSIPALFEAAGYAQATAQWGPEMNDYQRCVRAEIFRRDHTNVRDIESMKFLMQSNNFENDPISNGNPMYAISSRVDLEPVMPQCFGAIDAKVSSWRDWKSGQTVHAFSGPTPQQAAFTFAGANVSEAGCGPHFGQPEQYAFEWMKFKPFLLS